MWALRGAMFLILLGAAVIWIYAGVWMKEQGMGETFIGMLAGFGSALAAGLGLLWGWLSDRTGKSTAIVVAGCLLTGASLAVLAQSRAAPGFVLYQALAAGGLAATMSIMPLLALTLIGERHSGAGYGRFRIFGSFGYMFALYILAALVPGISRLCLTASLLIMLGTVPLVLANIQPRRHVRRLGFSALTRHPAMAGFLVAVFFTSMGGPAVFTFLSLYGKRLGMDQVAIGRLMGMCGVVALVGLPAMGSLADRFGPRRVMLIGFTAMPIRILLQAVARGPGGLYLAQLLHLFTWAGPEVTAYLYVTKLAGKRDRGVAISALVTTRTLGQFAGNPLCGWLAEHAGYRTMFLTMAAVSAFGLLLFVLFSRTPPASEL
ncbi:MAG: MFS transporter [Kiritimatiellaeota bacterium]|nr:MFS transporter [Kiritimatiellota bacterium]